MASFKNLVYILILNGFFTHMTHVLAQNTNVQKTVFEPGLISTSMVEYSASLSRNRAEIYFVRTAGSWGTSGKGTIYYSRREAGECSEPEIASFSGIYDDSDPHLSSDGTSLFFISDRTVEGSKSSGDIWIVKKAEDGKWALPQRLVEPVNSSASECSPRTDGKGNLYFASDRDGGYGQGDLYVARLENGIYQDPENLGRTINSEQGEWNLEVSENGDILIFEASGRKENVSGYGDLYLSFKKDHRWSVPQNIKELNTSGSDLYPQLFIEEDLLFFTSSDSLQSKNTDIYVSPIKEVLEKYRRASVFPQD